MNVQVIPNSLSTIIEGLSALSHPTPKEIIEILRTANVQVEDLMAWADFDHPVADSYGRKAVYEDPHFEVMVMSWAPGDFSAIHDHGQTQWGAVQVFGAAEHAAFSVREETLVTLSRDQLKPGTIMGVNNSLIHQMGNPRSGSPFLSLHVYGNLEASANITGDARIFDPANGLIYRVDGGVFYHLPRHEIKRVEKGPVGDKETRERHMVNLYSRLTKIYSSEGTFSANDLTNVDERSLS